MVPSGLVRPPVRLASEVALLRALGATVERARVTPSEAARGPSSMGLLRAPLMRCPPSHGGLASSATVPLYTTTEAFIDRAAAALLEADDARLLRGGCTEGGDGRGDGERVAASCDAPHGAWPPCPSRLVELL